MTKFKWVLKTWVPVLLWAVVIYSASGDSKSVHRSSRIIEPVVRWLVPDISDAAVGTTVFVVRKLAHVTEYAVLAMLLWWALRQTPRTNPPSGWAGRVAFAAWMLATLFAISDEFHQTFVPGRQGAVLDVVIDSAGAAAGLAVLWRVGRWRGRW